MKLSHPTDWLLFCPKLEVATAGTEAVLHHWELLLIGNHLRISGNPESGHCLRALPDHEIHFLPAQQLLTSLD
jgi:hypothetical protein